MKRPSRGIRLSPCFVIEGFEAALYNRRTVASIEERASLVLLPYRPADMPRVVIDSVDTVRVGRSSGCEVHLPKEARLVSRSHARLLRRGAIWSVIDESRWGTFIGGVRLRHGQAAELRDGDRLRFGDCEFVVQTGEQVQGGREDEALGYRLTTEPVDLASVDASRILRSSLALPEQLGRATSEDEIYLTACEFLLETLAPAIAQAFIVVAGSDGSADVVGFAPHVVGAEPVAQPVLSKRVLQRLMHDRECAVFLHRDHDDGTLGATVKESTRVLGASLLEIDASGRATILYALGNNKLDGDVQLVAQYLCLVATLVRQHLSTLRRAHLSNYLSPRVVELLCKKGGSAQLESSPRMVRATSLFFDVRGSTAAIEAAGGNLFAVYDDMLRIISIVTECVFQTSGTVIDYAGDGVFAAWGVPTPQADQDALAIECGQRIVRSLEHLELFALRKDRPLCGIGIAGGEVIAGAVGSTIIRKFGILGSSVNLAQRLATHSGPTTTRCRLLVGASVCTKEHSKRYRAVRIRTLELQGITSHEEVFEIAATDGTRDAFTTTG